MSDTQAINIYVDQAVARLRFSVAPGVLVTAETSRACGPVCPRASEQVGDLVAMVSAGPPEEDRRRLDAASRPRA
jgi:hypothetical protein